MSTVFYYAPDNNRPSWGLGMIYYHIWLLNKNKINSFLIHNKKPFKINWLNLDIPILYLDKDEIVIGKDDFLVIPEFHASDEWFKKIKCKKIVFIQNAFYLFDGLAANQSYEKLGFSTAFYYLPHLKKVLESLTNIKIYETPPFIAPYYFLADKESVRKKQILVYPKFENRDYNILLHLLEKKIKLKPRQRFNNLFFGKAEWELIELKDLSHEQVAAKMKSATFFISLNPTEAFNSAVPEAMAAGCINICYDGIGSRDFLINNENAFVFPNNDIFNLTNKLLALIENYDKEEGCLKSIQRCGFQTAEKYTIQNLEKKLVHFFESN